ncbi:hypothetical protein [Aquimarina sp. 2201CG5-10]|uniref:hypothetical protein n=1 Tax=Aquimarina callyspongiae TaxID=3098150 RepID=UPI002AB57967|nr:hypothetical protein [Aquimarina sp. 2201CG5-10]MDY8137498.1 hypothetical protein [Aquimarina sp. 2201CG5-10]
MKLLINFTLFLSSFTILGQKFHTEFKYADSIHKGISIQNSYPKGGLKYTDFYGKEYVYVIFWTSVTNQTASDIELTIDFPINLFTISISQGATFQLYVPKEKMTLKKHTLFDYGLDIKSFLDENIDIPSAISTTICANDSYHFYVVALSNRGANGVVRAGFELQKQDLFYKFNDYKIRCGQIVTIH